VRAVVSEVAAKYGCTVADILGQRRSGRLSIARFEVCARLRELNYGGAPPSLPLIGRWLQRHHTTVLHAIRRHAQRMGEGA
jgi:chromosomal replication initiation ATPase DnaA